MGIDLRILQPLDLERVAAFARARQQANSDDPMEVELQSWSAPWRGESLDHYLKLGWSFGAFREDSPQSALLGFALAQPLLFFRRQTQTLWVEHLEADSQEVAEALVDTLYRWARDKHLQKLVFSEFPGMQNLRWPRPLERAGVEEWQLSTTRSRP